MCGPQLSHKRLLVGFTLFAGQENGEYWFMRPKYE